MYNYVIIVNIKIINLLMSLNY